MPPFPRPTGAGFEPYVWAATVADVAARHQLSPAHVLRFDANLPPFAARLAVSPRHALAARGEYPEGSYRELREAAAAYAGCAPDELAVDAGADGLIGLVARTFLGPGSLAVTEHRTYPLYAIASRLEGAEVEAAPRELDALAAASRTAAVLWLCNPGNPGGELFAAKEIAELTRSLPATLVCVDEAYYEYGGETAAPAAPEIEPELRATTAERERVRAALLAAGFDAPPTHTNFVVVRTPQARTLAGQLERRGLVVRAYRDFLRITVRAPADDAPPDSTRSATVLGPGIHVSLVIDGSGRATSATGDEARDSRIEERAHEEGIDLELVGEAGLGDERVESALAHAHARADTGREDAQGNGRQPLQDRDRRRL